MGSEARARLGLAGLLTVTLLTLSQLFADGDYPGPILLGMLISAGIAIGARRLGIGTPSTLLLSAGALVVYVTFIFEAGQTWFGLPTPGAVASVIDSVSHSIEKSEADFAPIPVRTGYVVMFVTAMWLATTIGEIATFRWKRPLVASLPTTVLFATVLIVGTGNAGGFFVTLFVAALLTYWGLEASHRLRSWGRWVPTWTGAQEEEPISVTGGIARRMGAICVVATIAAPIVLPAFEGGLLRWRTGVGVGGPGSGGSGGRVDPFVSLAPRLLEQTDVRMFTARSEEPVYWRLVTLVGFDGATWEPLNDAEQVPDSGFVATGSGPPVQKAVEVDQTITIENLQGDYVPVATHPRTLLVEPAERQQDLRYGPETGDLRLEGNLERDLRFEATSDVPNVSFGDLRDAEPAGLAIADSYTDIPQDAISPAVELWLNETINNAGAETPYEELIAIQNRLRDTSEFTYSLRAVDPPGPSTDYLTNFLIDTRTGFCQQFATAFAALARHREYPTRLVVGFLPGEPTGGDGNERVIKGTDAHAWPEVYFEDYGWIAFEPTPRSEASRVAAAPPYTQSPTAPGSDNPELNDGPVTGIDPRTLADAAEIGLDPRERELFPSTIGDRTAPALGPRKTPAWVKTFTAVAVVASVLVLLFLASIPLLKEWRIRRAYALATTSGERAVAAFDDFATNAAELASARSPAESARAFAARVAELRGVPEGDAVRLASIYEASQYAPVSIPESDAAEAKSLAARLRANLWKGAPWWDKVVRLFSPVSLRARRVL